MRNKSLIAWSLLAAFALSLHAQDRVPFLKRLVTDQAARSSLAADTRAVVGEIRIKALAASVDMDGTDYSKMVAIIEDANRQGQIAPLAEAIQARLDSGNVTDDERATLRLCQLQILAKGFMPASGDLLMEIRSDLMKESGRPALKSFLSGTDLPFKFSVEALSLEKAGVRTVAEALALGDKLEFLLEEKSDVPLWIGRFIKALEFDFAQKFLDMAKRKLLVDEKGYAKFQKEIADGKAAAQAEIKAKKDAEAAREAARQREEAIRAGYSFREIPVNGGSFTMGNDASANQDEKPGHRVEIGALIASALEVTYAQYDAYCLDTGAAKPKDDGFGRGDRAVVNVSFAEAAAFCNWASRKKGLTQAYSISGTAVTWNRSANGYRLPTEAEWEYLAGGGASREGTAYAGNADIARVAWYSGSGVKSSQEVGKRSPNRLGIYDLSGNVWEWCWDWYDMGYYQKSSARDPSGPDSGALRVVRGGSWNNAAASHKIGSRGYQKPEARYNALGFRVVRGAR